MGNLEAAEAKIAMLENEAIQSQNIEEKLKMLERKYKTDISKL